MHIGPLQRNDFATQHGLQLALRDVSFTILSNVLLQNYWNMTRSVWFWNAVTLISFEVTELMIGFIWPHNQMQYCLSILIDHWLPTITQRARLPLTLLKCLCCGILQKQNGGNRFVLCFCTDHQYSRTYAILFFKIVVQSHQATSYLLNSPIYLGNMELAITQQGRYPKIAA